MTRIVQSREQKCDALPCSLRPSAATSDHNSLSGMEDFSASIARRRSMALITLTIRRRMRAAVRTTWTISLWLALNAIKRSIAKPSKNIGFGCAIVARRCSFSLIARCAELSPLGRPMVWGSSRQLPASRDHNHPGGYEALDLRLEQAAGGIKCLH